MMMSIGRFDMLRFLLPLLLIPTGALADPVTVAVSALTTVASASLAAGALAWSWTYFAATVALSLVSKALAPDPSDVANNVGGYDLSGVSSAADHAIIYGRTKVGGPIIYKETTDDGKYLHVVMALAGHQITSVDEVYLNDTLLSFPYTLTEGSTHAVNAGEYNGKVRVVWKSGSDSQTSISQLRNQSDGLWTSSHRLQGIAVLYVRMEFDTEVFPQGEPSISAVVKGKRVYNPSTQTTAYSANAALCLRDYLTSAYGINAEISEIDDTSFTAAYNDCDDDITLVAGGTEKRYEINGSFTTGTQPSKILETMTKSMAGSLWYAQGKFRCKAGVYKTPTYSFDEDDLRGNVQIQTRRSRRENFNIVGGKFKGEDSLWQETDFPRVKLSDSVIEDIDGGEEIETQINLPFTSSPSMAQRVAKVLLGRNREQLVVNVQMGLRGLLVQVGDVIQFTNTRAGWTNKTFEVLAWNIQPSRDREVVVALTLGETSSTVYDWNENSDEASFETNNTTLADAFQAPPVSVSVNTVIRVINEHVVNVMEITVGCTQIERADFVEVEFRKVTSPVSEYTQVGVGEVGLFEVLDIESGVSYDVRARAVNTFGIRGQYETLSNIAVNLGAEPPADVTNFNASVGGALLHLEWDAVADLDLSYYKIRHSKETTGGSWANASTAINKVARPANSVTLPARSGTYTIRAYDKLGNSSDDYTSLVVPTADIESFTTSTTNDQHTTTPPFSGTKSNLTVTSGNLRLTSTTGASYTNPVTGTYTFSGYTNVGQVRRVRARIDAEIQRFNSAGGLWNDIAGTFETWQGRFDSWTDPQNADHNVLFYISTTDDDPTGTPTWSDYKLFKSGDFSGHAFRFRVELISEAENVTPSIDFLTSVVEY